MKEANEDALARFQASAFGIVGPAQRLSVQSSTPLDWATLLSDPG